MGINCTSFYSHDRRFYGLQSRERCKASIVVRNIKSLSFVVFART